MESYDSKISIVHDRQTDFRCAILCGVKFADHSNRARALGREGSRLSDSTAVILSYIDARRNKVTKRPLLTIQVDENAIRLKGKKGS